ncbi:cilia- and flagella-associated protein 58-like [Leptopilina boulardi]|uniref:cilia- and flagella-associated protein 58-like n=1 Tax=Leptopilina boulardi TaxID=63433 RepID=UPI0021F67557|nr:cilia- and flagella-associated protein 58-like [Leptopilina boulardi]
MDNSSDSSNCEFDSIKSGESLMHLIDDELHSHCSISNLLSNVVDDESINKRATSLELANERLRIDMENLRIELNTKIAANQGLKDKITVLYVDAQASLQEKRKLEINLKNLESQLLISENSTKWYQKQLHQVEASKKTLQIEVETYQEMLKQKQQLVANIILKCSQLNNEYANLVTKYKEEKNYLQNEINNQQLNIKKKDFMEIISTENQDDNSMKLETIEEELRVTKVQQRDLEEKLLNSEAKKTCMENTFLKQCSIISSMDDNQQRLVSEKNELELHLREMNIEIEKFKSNQNTAELALTISKQNQIQVEEAISELQIQLSKMLTQYKHVKTRNLDLEEKVTLMQEALDESKRLKLLSFNANSSLLQKLKKEKQKVKKFECLLNKKQNIQRPDEENKTDNSVENCLQQALNKNKELKEQLKSITRVSEESVDEGYGDGTSLGPTANLPSSPALNPVLLLKINDILYKSKHLMNPIQTGVNELQMKIEKFKEEQNSKILLPSTNFYNNRSISTISSPNNTRTLV